MIALLDVPSSAIVSFEQNNFRKQMNPQIKWKPLTLFWLRGSGGGKITPHPLQQKTGKSNEGMQAGGLPELFTEQNLVLHNF